MTIVLVTSSTETLCATFATLDNPSSPFLSVILTYNNVTNQVSLVESSNGLAVYPLAHVLNSDNLFNPSASPPLTSNGLSFSAPSISGYDCCYDVCSYDFYCYGSKCLMSYSASGDRSNINNIYILVTKGPESQCLSMTSRQRNLDAIRISRSLYYASQPILTHFNCNGKSSVSSSTEVTTSSTSSLNVDQLIGIILGIGICLILCFGLCITMIIHRARTLQFSRVKSGSLSLVDVYPVTPQTSVRAPKLASLV